MKSLTLIRSIHIWIALCLSTLGTGELGYANSNYPTSARKGTPSKTAKQSPTSQSVNDMKDSSRPAPRAASRQNSFDRYESDDQILAHFFDGERDLRKQVQEYYYEIDIKDYEQRRYTVIESTDAHYRHKMLLELINDDETTTLLIIFDQYNQVVDMKKIGEIDLKAEAWKVVHRNIEATNQGNVEGQLACYADVVSPYYDKGKLKKPYIKFLLRDWENNYQYYHMREIWTRVKEAPSRNSRADYMVDVKFEVTWKAKKGRYKHSRTYIATYGVRAGIEPKIVSTTLKRC